MDNNVHECGTWTDNAILSETMKNTNNSESEDEPQKEKKVTTVSYKLNTF